jgi:hypothetical protein
MAAPDAWRRRYLLATAMVLSLFVGTTHPAASTIWGVTQRAKCCSFPVANLVPNIIAVKIQDGNCDQAYGNHDVIILYFDSPCKFTLQDGSTSVTKGALTKTELRQLVQPSVFLGLDYTGKWDARRQVLSITIVDDTRPPSVGTPAKEVLRFAVRETLLRQTE